MFFKFCSSFYSLLWCLCFLFYHHHLVLSLMSVCNQMLSWIVTSITASSIFFYLSLTDHLGARPVLICAMDDAAWFFLCQHIKYMQVIHPLLLECFHLVFLPSSCSLAFSQSPNSVSKELQVIATRRPGMTCEGKATFCIWLCTHLRTTLHENFFLHWLGAGFRKNDVKIIVITVKLILYEKLF